MLPNKTKEDALSAREFRTLVHYDPLTGIFTWKVRAGNDGTTKRFNTMFAGKPTGTPGSNGYIRIGLDNESYSAHRLAWLYMTGEWPEDQIDHVDRDPSNNRWNNLRAVTCQENQTNRGNSVRNTSGTAGVAWDRKYKKWRAGIFSKGVNYPLGFFDNIADAVAARTAKQADLWKLQNGGAL